MSRSEALVLAGHGSQRRPESAATVRSHAAAIRDRGGFAEVRTAFWKEEPTLRDVPRLVGSDVAYVVPVLTSEGYFAETVFPRELGLDGERRDPDHPVVRYAEPVGTHDRMATIVEQRAEAAVEGPPSAAGVALVGHGTERHERSGDATSRLADRLRRRGRFAEVSALFLDQEPAVESALEVLDAPEVVVVPFFVAEGYHTTRDLPAALEHPGVGSSTRRDGRLVHLTGAVGTDDRLADLVVDRAVEAGAHPGRTATDDKPLAAERTFLAAVDRGQNGLEWGELVIASGEAGYDLRHREDVDTPTAALEALPGPAALRQRCRRDAHGRYRPLSGARTLPTGWRLGGLDGRGLYLAVRGVYPGSIASWFRARSDGLDPTSFSASAGRQTGRYAGLEAINGRELSAVTEAVCGDCVRSPRWRGGREESSEEAPAHGDIPCREACPFLRSAARALVGADGDVAEAEDPAVAVADFAEPANRYRVRYGRALARRGEQEAATGGGA